MKIVKGRIYFKDKAYRIELDAASLPKPKLTFSKKIIVYASVIYAVVLVVSIVSWFMYREISMELKGYATGLYTAALAFYKAKACVENKAKIECNYKESEGE